MTDRPQPLSGRVMGKQSARLTKEEQETIITKTAAEDGWAVYTSIPKHRRRLAVLASKWGVPTEPDDAGGLSADLPEKAVAFRNPTKKRASRTPGHFPPKRVTG